MVAKFAAKSVQVVLNIVYIHNLRMKNIISDLFIHENSRICKRYYSLGEKKVNLISYLGYLLGKLTLSNILLDTEIDTGMVVLIYFTKSHNC